MNAIVISLSICLPRFFHISSSLVQFPMSIDRLKRDNGAVLGPTPVVLQATHMNEFALYLLGNETGQAIEFGAHQVIIVRSEESKEKLPPSLRHGTICTLILFYFYFF